jgi:DNA-binding GntR family transcriptional regulator
VSVDAHDRRFHQLIVETLGNPRVTRSLAALRDAARLGWTAAPDDATRLDHEHREILSAIERRDPEAAAAEMERHILRTGTLQQERLLGHPRDMGWQRRLHDHIRAGAAHPERRARLPW